METAVVLRNGESWMQTGSSDLRAYILITMPDFFLGGLNHSSVQLFVDLDLSKEKVIIKVAFIKIEPYFSS